MHNSLNTSIKADQLLFELALIKNELGPSLYKTIYSDFTSGIGDIAHLLYRFANNSSLSKTLAKHYTRLKSSVHRCTVAELKSLLYLEKHKFKHLCVILDYEQNL